MSATQLKKDNELLIQKNKSLSSQLDKITNDLFKMQDVASDLNNRLENKKHTEQLAGWAIDRALETAKLVGSGITDTKSVLEAAKAYCEWIGQSYVEPEPKQLETLQ